MSKIEESVEVGVPVGVAYDLWTQFVEFPRFMSGVERIDQVSDTLTHWVASVDGVHREFDARVTEQIPDERIAWESVSGSDQRGVVTFHRMADDRARVMLQLDLDPHGVLDVVADRLGFVSHQVLRDLGEFKRFIESRYAPVPAGQADTQIGTPAGGPSVGSGVDDRGGAAER